MDDVDRFLTGWHRTVAERDLDALRALLSEDVSLGAPPYWARIEGRALVHHLLGLILHTIEDFTYHREWRNGSELALEFMGHVGAVELQGIDLISLGDSAVIRKLDVLIRPANGVEALTAVIAPQMMAFVTGRRGDEWRPA